MVRSNPETIKPLAVDVKNAARAIGTGQRRSLR